jgi:hypothetical protein
MVNLEKISELLEKGIENPSIQNDEGRFSAEKWRKEVKAYTEPFLLKMKERLNQALASEKAFSQGRKFKVLRKTQGKQRRISDLQEIKCNLAKPFSIDVREDDRRPINGIVAIGPASNLSGEDYVSSLCWGLDWWGSKEIAQKVYSIFGILNGDNAMTVSQSGDDFGKTIRLFNHINGEKLKEQGFESIVDAIIKDFLRLSSILSQNKRLFENFDKDNERQLKRDDVENAIRSIRSRTGKTEISKPDVLKEIETQQKKGNPHLKSRSRHFSPF